MTNVPAADIPQRVLLGPGPSDVPPRVLAAMAQPTIGHLDPAFLALMDQTRTMLQQLWRTDNELTLAVSGTGSAGMQALLANLIEPGEQVLVGVNGVFGGRVKDAAQRLGAQVHALEAPWGQVFDPRAVIDEVKRVRPQLVVLVHAETSTGAHQPIEGLADAVHDAGGLLVLDCVTSLGGVPVEIDAWGVDAAFSGTQKCLSAPPGLSPVTLSPRAVAKLEARKSKVPSWYLDLTMVRNYWGEDRTYHHTAPINMLYGLHEALRIVLEEGLEARWTRHQQMHARLRAGLEALRLRYLSDPAHTLPMLNCVAVPEGVDEAALRRGLLEEYGIEVGAGLGAFKGSAIRVGLMGHSATGRNVALVLAALEAALAGRRAPSLTPA